MRLAIVSLMGGQQWGGSEMLWHALAKHALAQGDKVFVSVYGWKNEHPKIKEIRKSGAKISYRKKFNSDAGLAEKIIRSVKKRKPHLNKDYRSIIDFKPDHVFISQGGNFDLAVHHRAFYKLLIENGINYSLVCHGHEQYGEIPPKEIYPEGRLVFENAKKVFFVSKRQWALTERRLLQHVQNGDITWNPLNMKFPAKPFPMPANGTFNMAIVGALNSGKGHDTALEVLNSPEWKSRKWYLNIYGTGPGRDYLQDAANFFHISDKVIFHGHTDDVDKIWRNNHLLLIPSSGEGLPVSLVEAMAAGRPAVVTDIGGNAEVIEDTVTGFIAAAPTVGSFYEALERAWEAEKELAQMGTAAFKKISRILDMQPAATLYQKLKDA